MIFTEDQFNNAFYDWIQLALPGINVQRLNDNGPRPDLPYISYRINGFNKVGSYEIARPDIAGNTTLKGHIEIPIYFQAHGANALTNLQVLSRSVYIPDTQEFLKSEISTGFIEELSPPTSIPLVLDSSYENRASLDLRFRTHDEVTIQVGCIETVELEIDYNDGEFIDEFVIELNP